MSTVTVVGAGFSGLTTAYFFVKLGAKVRILEKSARVGGLIETIQTEHGLVEKAANGILNSGRLETMAADIGVPLLPTKREGRKRLIYRRQPRQIPLNLSEWLRVGARAATQAANLKPQPCESISCWGRRVVGSAATDYLLTPALGGIYAGDPNRLSASLIFGRTALPAHLQTSRPARGKARGTLAPPFGMQQLTDGLREWLARSGVEFILNHDLESAPAIEERTVVCLSAKGAADYLEVAAPAVSNQLRRIEMLSLVTATAFYRTDAAKLNAFGCLFPRDQGFRALGVLFNTSIFDGRGPAHSETWIFGGALDPDAINLTDEEFARVVSKERRKFYGKHDDALALYVSRRPQSIPHYTIELEQILTNLAPTPGNIGLVGNYLGRLGLAKLIERAALVAQERADKR